MTDHGSRATGPVGADPARGWFIALFLTDMWERFGYYSMQAILVLFAVAPARRGGLALPTGTAAALFGAYLGLTFLFALPGGWLGDRVLGLQRAVLAGALVTAAGYAALAAEPHWCTAAGLLLVAAGGGLFKPNQQALVNVMCGPDRARREATVSAFYVGVQLSALLAPLLSGFLGERINWHLGFAASGAAMLLTAAQFQLGRRYLAGVGVRPGRPLDAATRGTVVRRVALVLLVVVALVTAGGLAGLLGARLAIAGIGLLTLLLPVGCYLALLRNPQLTAGERRGLRTMLWLFLGSGLFWMLVSQAGSVLNLFAQRSTDRDVLGFTMPASWLQSATPLCVLLLAPVFAWQLRRVGARLSVPVKFAIGLLLVGASFLIMAVAAALAASGTRVSALWLVVVYFLHACGELVTAAVGISATADVVSPAFLGQTLGVWWLFAALGGGLGSQVVRLVDVLPDQAYYLGLGLAATAAGALFLVRRAHIAATLHGGPDPVAAPSDPSHSPSSGRRPAYEQAS